MDGKVVWRDDKSLQRVRRKIGMVFQHFNLFPHMTVLDNVIEAPIHVLGLRRADAIDRADHLLSLVGMREKAKAWPRQLSGGQQQRAAIARALAMEPRIMLFDEITSALDPELVGEVLRVVRQIARDKGMTMLIVTHEMNFARDVADRVIFMSGGKIVEDGPPEIVLSDPQEAETRSFLRSILEDNSTKSSIPLRPLILTEDLLKPRWVIGHRERQHGENTRFLRIEIVGGDDTSLYVARASNHAAFPGPTALHHCETGITRHHQCRALVQGRTPGRQPGKYDAFAAGADKRFDY